MLPPPKEKSYGGCLKVAKVPKTALHNTMHSYSDQSNEDATGLKAEIAWLEVSLRGYQKGRDKKIEQLRHALTL